MGNGGDGACCPDAFKESGAEEMFVDKKVSRRWRVGQSEDRCNFLSHSYEEFDYEELVCTAGIW
jgi:hypothetical protein